MMNGAEHGAPMSRDRWWAVVIDLLPEVTLELGTESLFREILACLKTAKYDPEMFMLDSDVLERLHAALPYGCGRGPPKRFKEDNKWKMIHEKLCLMKNLVWPRLCESMGDVNYSGFREREAEVVNISDALFPNPAKLDVYYFFDANHTAERALASDRLAPIDSEAHEVS